jgi:hypothetical protein
MVISHVHKYLFIELPRTGSTAIRKELEKNYSGVPILYKHSTYYDFLKVATTEEKKYFVFSCIRNPLDSVLSYYFKCKTNHRQQFTDPSKMISKGIVGFLDSKIFNCVKNTNADFPTFFMKLYRIPYNNWSHLSHEKFDFVIRFENLQDDFAKALTLIGIEPKRPLPLANKTGMKEGDFLFYYTPETVKRAKRVFGPFMSKWGYEFPSEWGDTSVPWWNQMEFELFNVFRNFYWRCLRFKI